MIRIHALVLIHALWLVAASSPAQDRLRATAQLLVRGAPADVILNGLLLTAFGNSPSAVQAVGKCVAWDGTGTPPAVFVRAEGAHAAGVFQFEVEIAFAGFAPTPEQRSQAMTALLDQLRQRIDAVMYLQPRDEYGTRAAELHKRLQDLRDQETALRQRVREVRTDLAPLRAGLLQTEQSLVQARVDAATEKAAVAQLQRLRDESAAELGKLQGDAAVRKQKLDVQQSELNRIDAELRAAAAQPNKLAAMREQMDSLRRLRQETEALRAEFDRGVAAQQLPRSLEEQVLAHLPPTMVAVERAKARVDNLQVLAEEQRQALAAAAAREVEGVALEAEANRKAGEAVIVEALLTEVRARLERLQPVRYDVF